MADLFAERAIWAYRNCGKLLTPAAGWLLDARMRRGKEDPKRRPERLGHASRSRPSGRLTWVHAASVGETISAFPMIDWLIGAGGAVLLTTGTVTSAAIAESRLPSGAIHQYVPLDLAPCIGRFLDHWQPEAALFVESEIWPTTVVDLERRGIPQILVNGRISERSLSRWSRVERLANSLFRRFALVLAQSEADAGRFQRLGARRVEVTGNIKFDSQPLAADPEELSTLTSATAGRPVFLAASTHAGEEALIAAAHGQIAARVAGLLTVIVPRHPARAGDIEAHLTTAGLTVTRRSRGELPDGRTDIYLADTMGELGLFYRLARVAFIGGSLAPIGGHNPIEAAQLGAAILHGPHVHNFRDIFAELDRTGGARAVIDAAALAATASDLLNDRAAAGQLAATAAAIARSGRGALERTRVALVQHVAGGWSEAGSQPA